MSVALGLEFAPLLFLMLLGHTALWVALVNRVHATGWPPPVIKMFSILGFVPAFLLPAIVGLWIVVDGTIPDPIHGPLLRPFLPYLAVCCPVAVWVIVSWLRRHVLHRPPAVLRSRRSREADTRTVTLAAESAHHHIVHFPGNEALELDITEQALDVPRLPAALDGLTIAHLSDLHFTGKVGRSYFEEVVRLCNEFDADVVAVTGDIVDRAACIDWIPHTLGRLRARDGVYFVLGNHDKKVDYRRVVSLMEECGAIYLGGRWKEARFRNERVVLAGNEVPWFPPLPDLTGCPSRDEAPFRLMLAHSPDQFAWARQADADLLLAGHTHGGQIRLPLLGPIVSPSYDGVAYASGLFHIPPTIMHVSRGLSGQLPLRFNCRPEITHLTLHAGKK